MSRPEYKNDKREDVIRELAIQDLQLLLGQNLTWPKHSGLCHSAEVDPMHRTGGLIPATYRWHTRSPATRKLNAPPPKRDDPARERIQAAA